MAAEVVSDSSPHTVGSASEMVLGDLVEVGRTSHRDAALQSGRPSRAALGLKLSILMPAFNEERTIARAVGDVLDAELPCDFELIVINDGSTDRTAEILTNVADARVMVHHHERNQGKGAALLSAIERATGTHLLPFDADLEYAPEDIARLLEPVLRGRCDVVYGARLFGFNTVYNSYWFALGNRILTRIANVLYNASLSDLHTCLKLIPSEFLRPLELRESGFGLDTEITAHLLRAGVRPFEVPVSYFGRSRSEGKKINWRDAVACIWILLRIRFRRAAATQARLPDVGEARSHLTLTSVARNRGLPSMDQDDGDYISVVVD